MELSLASAGPGRDRIIHHQHQQQLLGSGSLSHWPLSASLDQSATTTARPGPRDLCGGGEPRAAAGRPRGLALHAALDLAGHHHEGLLNVGGVLCRSLEELDPERVRECLVQKKKNGLSK